MTLVESAGEFTLQKRYEAESGEVLVTGIQALVRLPLDQMRADRRARLNTAAFISGYQGSPLGGYDRELQSQRTLLDALNIVHVAGLNEELAATSVMGSQVADTYPTRKYDGVTGIWYGKAPGLDRAGDAIRHANFAGTGRKGGVLALVGDDAASKSSTLPSRSDPALVALYLPVLYPGTQQEILDLGLHGIAMSRAAGLWVAMKITTPVADGAGTAMVDPGRFASITPTIEFEGRPWQPKVTGQIGPPYTNAIEVELLGQRSELAMRYVVENRLNRFVSNPGDAWLAIVAGGYDCEQLLDALRVLGVSRDRLSDLGIRVLKLGALHPLDAAILRDAARGVSTVMVVEDKIDFLETRLRSALYGMANAPAVVGKRDHEGKALIAHYGALTADNLVESLRRVLTLRIPADQLAPVAAKEPFRLKLSAESTRTPFFCSGCPHNTGLQVPDGSLVGAGIGCHGMVTMVTSGKNGDVMGLTQMGGEGAQWIGTAPFVTTPHLFQNIGDGTYFHSGQLAVQASISAGTTVTYKILYNAAVAMTGGQDASGLRPVPDLARKLLAEGVKRVAITTDDPTKYRGLGMPGEVTVSHRDKIIEVQEELRKISGVTVLIHYQQCATEKRRDRKRGILAPATYRVAIDERVCEGCGDCGVQSNCLSLHPLETEFGRKTTVDQASCNIDASCLRGDCPAFVTVKPARSGSRGGGRSPSKRIAPPSIDGLAVPRFLRADMVVRMPGIGGTGVVTVSQVLAVAAKIAGRTATTNDQTGLSQKAGPVVSTVTIGDPAPGKVDVLLAFDALTAVTAANLSGLERDYSVAVVSTSVTPTGRMVGKLDSMTLDLVPISAEISLRTTPDRNLYVDAAGLTAALMGNSVTANVFMLGVAYQAGLVPIDAGAIEQAIELNGTAVDANLASFRWGRHWTADPQSVARMAGTKAAYDAAPYAVDGIDDVDLRHAVELRAGDLVSYQSKRYADRYVDVVRRAYVAEQAAGSDGTFARSIAQQLHHLMAYKDEYEVARLLLAGRDRVAEQFGEGAKVTWNLHPPMLRSMGVGHKIRFGGWSKPVMGVLRAGKRLRGTPVDPFGFAKVRRTERALVGEYIELVDRAVAMLAADRARAVRLVGLVDQVRGYESVKMRNVDRYRTALAAELAAAKE